MAEGRPTLHHLNNSQSQRILWLCEELRLASVNSPKPFNYNVVSHLRGTSGPGKSRAPPEMLKTHPLGKAPQLVTADGSRTIAESSAIAKYLILTYDVTGTFGAKNKDDHDDLDAMLLDEELSNLANASLAPVVTQDFFLEILSVATPFFIRPLMRLVQGMVRKNFTSAEYDRMYGYLDAKLADGRKYFAGENPGRQDFMLSWPADFCVQRKYVDLTNGGKDGKGYPNVLAWRERVLNREGWKEALKKGNGYDLVSLGM